jgi:hypothetical protein
MTMLRINWSQIKTLQTHLARQGFQPETEVLAIVMFKKNETVKNKIEFGKLQEFLFSLEGDSTVTGIFLFDVAMKRPLWSAKIAERKDSLEVIPNSGHPTIVSEFKNLSPQQKDVWLDITLASIMNYLKYESDNR